MYYPSFLQNLFESGPYLRELICPVSLNRNTLIWNFLAESSPIPCHIMYIHICQTPNIILLNMGIFIAFYNLRLFYLSLFHSILFIHSYSWFTIILCLRWAIMKIVLSNQTSIDPLNLILSNSMYLLKNLISAQTLLSYINKIP